jgi:hypothetical protein
MHSSTLGNPLVNFVFCLSRLVYYLILCFSNIYHLHHAKPFSVGNSIGLSPCSQGAFDLPIINRWHLPPYNPTRSLGLHPAPKLQPLPHSPTDALIICILRPTPSKYTLKAINLNGRLILVHRLRLWWLPPCWSAATILSFIQDHARVAKD